jgi:hypothetical protein
MKGGRGFFDNLYCWVLGWIWKDASCRTPNQMVKDVQDAPFVYGGRKKTKRMKHIKNKTHKK